jgi:hypothetical protein
MDRDVSNFFVVGGDKNTIYGTGVAGCGYTPGKQWVTAKIYNVLSRNSF